MTTCHKIIAYPVGNGDTCQIILENGRRILLDYRHQQCGETDDNPHLDLKKHLQDELNAAKRDYFDVVAFTHADDDHICGSTDFFHLEFSKKYQGSGRIKIETLWVPAAMVVETARNDQQSDEFVVLRDEARYRLLKGEGIRVFSKPLSLTEWLEPALERMGLPKNARDHLFVDAGTLAPGFSLSDDQVEFFTHSPFIEHCGPGCDVVRNDASLIFNIRFEAEGRQYNYMAIGDSTWDILEQIVDITKYHGRDDRLDWDLFNIPHHCSYLALSDEKGEKETEPKAGVEKFLLHGQPGANMICSSKPIVDIRSSYEQTQPPHIQAHKAYVNFLNKVSGRKVLVTMETPNATRPEPLVFHVTSGGITYQRSDRLGAAAIVSAAAPRVG